MFWQRLKTAAILYFPNFCFFFLYTTYLIKAMNSLLKKTLTNVLETTKKIKVLRLGGLQQKRHFNLHEHHSMKLLEQAGAPVPKFVVIKNKSEAHDKARRLNMNDMVVKAQVLTGGRGKGTFKGGLKGGVLLVKSPEEAEKVASQMLGDYLVTVQTGSKGVLCNAVMITERKFIVKEYYVAILMERKFGGPVFVTSSSGGVEIEVLSKNKPEAVGYTAVDIVKGLTKEQSEEIAVKLDLKDKKAEVGNIMMKLYDLFVKKDATMVEINPMGQDKEGNIWCLDAKFKFDESAAYRQEHLHALRDFSQEDPREIEADKYGLSYVAMKGAIGCLVNGAGLAMATMDIIKYHGGQPANFLDVGGGANEQQVKMALKIITSDPDVMAIFVNIFGGIMKCDVIAQGIILAVQELDIKVPIVCRLQGTNVDEARIMLGVAKVKILPVPDLDEASRLAVKISQIMTVASTVKVKVSFEMPI